MKKRKINYFGEVYTVYNIKIEKIRKGKKDEKVFCFFKSTGSGRLLIDYLHINLNGFLICKGITK